ncbi:MAG: NAD(P)H-dependent oxidoreductase subunit E [Phycisphaerales bacterium]|jgi:NADH-quinone oxidoreductase subunit E|nr:NAD(P)H-dependent oxidoreductase subunit E [Phycisphaerales bacterium]
MTCPTEATPQRKFERVCEILDANDRRPERLIPILQAVQDEYSYLPEDVMSFLATALGLPAARVYGVATFYAHFSLEPKGKYVVKLCDGTACHVRGSIDIYDAIRDSLGLEPEQHTTDDMLFTVETVSCLGACGLAPVVLINEDVHGQMNPESTVALIQDLVNTEKEGDNADA